MNKKSYENSREERLRILNELPFYPQKESSTEQTGRGWNLQEFSQDINGYTNILYYEEDEKERNEEDLNNSINFLKNLNQELKEEGQEAYADFVGFLIKKIAEEAAANPIKKFNELILKINSADISDKNDLIKKLTKIFSKTVLLEMENYKNIIKAQESAYKKVIHRAEQHLSSGKMLKVAQVENNPILVARNIKSIIDTLVSRFSSEARIRAYPNLRNKILRLNQNDIANKRSPGGAAIGAAITLIKNILNGRDRSFISAVINNLGMLL